jgi:NAD(P)H-nitrite reductase large subunit
LVSLPKLELLVNKTRHVIIGNSAAALSAARAIRKRDSSSPITLISAENCNAYSPVLTTYYIAGKIGRGNMFIADDSFYQGYNISKKLGSRAVKIDSAKQAVYLEDGTAVEYDDLLIATGASAKPMDKVEAGAARYVSTLRTIEDAEKIIRLSEKAGEVVVIGGGLVSLQIANAIFPKRVKVTMVIGSRQLLSRNVDVECAAIIQRRLESQGVSLLFGREVRAIRKKGNKACVVTGSGEELPADMVVVGKGVKPNTELVLSSGVKVKGGILVNESMRTNIENIFAAGDVAEGKDSISGETEVIANWPSACAQGEVAGLNMAGYPAKREGQFKENITTLLGLTVASIGSSKGQNGNFEELKYINPREEIYRKFLLSGNKIIEAVLLGKIQDVGVIRNCIQNGINISPWKDMIARAPLDFADILRAL